MPEPAGRSGDAGKQGGGGGGGASGSGREDSGAGAAGAGESERKRRRQQSSSPSDADVVPAGWEVRVSKSKGRRYAFNRATGETKWLSKAKPAAAQ
jgi:hypothetical protein